MQSAPIITERIANNVTMRPPPLQSSFRRRAKVSDEIARGFSKASVVRITNGLGSGCAPPLEGTACPSRPCDIYDIGGVPLIFNASFVDGCLHLRSPGYGFPDRRKIIARDRFLRQQEFDSFVEIRAPALIALSGAHRSPAQLHKANVFAVHPVLKGNAWPLASLHKAVLRRPSALPRLCEKNAGRETMERYCHCPSMSAR